MPARPWGDLTTEECREGALRAAVAVLPVAAVEQHGPHLPLSTDVVIAEGYLARVADLVPADLDVRVLPVQSVGLSPEHADFPGTLTLTPETALRAWGEIGDGVARAGCRRLVIVSSHGGNSALVDLVAWACAAGTGWWRSPPPGAASARRRTRFPRTRCATASMAAASRPP